MLQPSAIIFLILQTVSRDGQPRISSEVKQYKITINLNTMSDLRSCCASPDGRISVMFHKAVYRRHRSLLCATRQGLPIHLACHTDFLASCCRTFPRLHDILSSTVLPSCGKSRFVELFSLRGCPSCFPTPRLFLRRHFIPNMCKFSQ